MDADRRWRASGGRRWFLLAFVVVALIPIVGSAIRLGHAGWLPEGDDAMIARRTMSVFSTHPPLSGQPSTAGNLFTLAHPPAPGGGAATPAAEIDASHPGPLEYYLLAVPYRLGGWSPWALLAAVALVNGACVVAAVVFAWRRLGVVGGLAATVAVLVVAERLGTWNLARPLNASIAVLPLLTGLVTTWAALDGDRWAVVVAAACLSLVVQAHLGAAPLGAVILLLALAGPVWLRFSARLSRGPGRPLSPSRHQRSIPNLSAKWSQDDHIADKNGHASRWPALAAVVVLAVAWVLVLVEQVTADGRGNVTRLAEVARLEVDRAGLGFGLAAVAKEVVRPVWPGVGPLPRISIIGPIAFAPAMLQLLAVAVLLVAAAVWGQRSGRRWLMRMVAVVAVAVVVPMLVLARGPDEVRLGPAYQLTSLVAVSAFLAFALTAALATAVRPFFVHTVAPTQPHEGSTRRSPQVVGLAVLTLAVVALATAVFGGPTYATDNHRTQALADAIRAKVPKGTYKLSAQGTWAYLSSLDAVSVDLLRHGYDIRVVRLGTIPKEPQRRNLDVDAPTIVLASDGKRPPNGQQLVDLPPLPSDPTWAGNLLAAVSRPDVRIVAAPPPLNQHSDRPTTNPTTKPTTKTAPGTGGRVVTQDPAGPSSPSRSESSTPCADEAVQLARRLGDDPAQRRATVLAILHCSQAERRAVLGRITFRGLDQFWVDLLGSNMPAPFPHSGLAAYLVPAEG